MRDGCLENPETLGKASVKETVQNGFVQMNW